MNMNPVCSSPMLQANCFILLHAGLTPPHGLNLLISLHICGTRISHASKYGIWTLELFLVQIHLLFLNQPPYLKFFLVLPSFNLLQFSVPFFHYSATPSRLSNSFLFSCLFLHFYILFLFSFSPPPLHFLSCPLCFFIIFPLRFFCIVSSQILISNYGWGETTIV